MLEFLADYGLFFAKAVTILGVVLLILGAIFSGAQRSKQDRQGNIKTKHLNKELKEMQEQMLEVLLTEDELKQKHKEHKKLDKQKKKAEKKQAKGDAQAHTPRLFVIDFDGDKEGNQVENLRREVTALLSVADKGDEVLLRVESPGGMVHTYGLAAAQLERIKKAGLHLTISVDKVAASGGYLMACIADKLLAAPFAIVGSVGVLVEITNFNKLLKKNNIDVEVLTAGEYKHTISMLGEITPEAREKTLEELHSVHTMFKNFVSKYRPQLDIEKIATGEYWHGSQAIELNMVDELITSDEYLCKKCDDEVEVFEISYKEKETLGDRLGIALAASLDRAMNTLLKRLHKPVV